MALRLGRRSLAAATLVALGPLLAPSAPAQSAWPDRPLRLVAPYQPGGGTDLVGRIVAQKLSDSLGQPVVVENRSGAAGTIAGRYVAGSPPDGYTLLIDSLSIAQNASRFRNPPFDAENGLLPIAQLVELPFVIAVNRDTPARSVRELVELAKRQPGSLNVAESGTSPRLVAELFRLIAGLEFTFVPYRGSAPAVAAVLSGEVNMFFSDLPSIAQHITRPDSPVAALAITSRQRSPLLPDVPTAREVDMPDFEVMSWYAIFAPRGTPTEIAQRLNREINAALEAPDVRARLIGMSADPAPMGQAEFAAFYKSEIARWRDVIRRAEVPMLD